MDENNTNIFERPPHAHEFIIWSVCTNPGADPQHNAWRPARVKGKTVTVNLDPESHAIAALLGNSNVSAGLRIALQRAMMPPAPPAAAYPPIPYPPGFGQK